MTAQIARGLLMVLLLAAGLRCSSPEKSTLCFVSSWTETEGSLTREYTFVYESSRLQSFTLSESGTTTVTQYRYNDNGKIGNSTKKSGSVLVEEGSYNYDLEGKLLVAKLIGSDYETTIQYSYNEYGQLAKEVETRVAGGTSQVITRNFGYPDILTMNPSLITMSTGGSTPDQLEVEYDNKIAPLRGLFPAPGAVNNVVKESYVDGGTQTKTTVSTTYQYNTEGYPVSAVSTSGKTQTWVYDCKEI